MLCQEGGFDLACGCHGLYLWRVDDFGNAGRRVGIGVRKYL